MSKSRVSSLKAKGRKAKVPSHYSGFTHTIATKRRKKRKNRQFSFKLAGSVFLKRL